MLRILIKLRLSTARKLSGFPSKVFKHAQSQRYSLLLCESAQWPQRRRPCYLRTTNHKQGTAGKGVTGRGVVQLTLTANGVEGNQGRSAKARTVRLI